jgi:hypothetical protein
VKKVNPTIDAVILVQNVVKNLKRVVAAVHLNKVEAKVHVIAQENVDLLKCKILLKKIQ